MQYKFLVFFLFSVKSILYGQSDFNYHIQLTPITISDFGGIQSFAHAQYQGKWVFIGGRLDGLHARQPFNAFPSNSNNTFIRVVDPLTLQQWTAPLSTLSLTLKEQLQATNLNFRQDGDNLIVIGGYAFSATANDHITFNKITIINLPLLVQYVQTGTLQSDAFYQITDNRFAVTGGQLAKINDTFYLVGGQRFDGRYNPMNNPTFTQSYTDSYKKFKLINTNNQWQITDYEEVIDAVHLHRRDYNLVPQIFSDGSEGYMISSGVFQINANLPFLYPVDIKSTGYEPKTNFNQLLSNYHGAHAEMYSATEQKMHALFFGGMSQYYYTGSTLIQDTNIPFVKTISRVTRNNANELVETRQPEEMPIYVGAGSEFIPNHALPHFDNEVIKLDEITSNEFVIGHIVGGIASSLQNPFTINQTGQTGSSSVIYEVKLINQPVLDAQPVMLHNPFSFEIYPNPILNQKIKLNYEFPYEAPLEYMVTDVSGKMIMEGEILKSKIGSNSMDFELEPTASQVLQITLIYDNKFYQTKKIIIN